MSEGRTNAIWKIGGGTAAIVCKLYHAAADSPLFPNDADVEARALSTLAGTGPAPELIALSPTSLGPCLLYRHVEGRPFHGDVAEVARALPVYIAKIDPLASGKSHQGQRPCGTGFGHTEDLHFAAGAGIARPVPIAGMIRRSACIPARRRGSGQYHQGPGGPDFD